MPTHPPKAKSDVQQQKDLLERMHDEATLDPDKFEQNDDG